MTAEYVGVTPLSQFVVWIVKIKLKKALEGWRVNTKP